MSTCLMTEIFDQNGSWTLCWVGIVENSGQQTLKIHALLSLSRRYRNICQSTMGHTKISTLNMGHF